MGNKKIDDLGCHDYDVKKMEVMTFVLHLSLSAADRDQWVFDYEQKVRSNSGVHVWVQEKVTEYENVSGEGSETVLSTQAVQVSVSENVHASALS